MLRASVLTNTQSKSLVASVLCIVWLSLLEMPIVSALAIFATISVTVLTGSLLLYTAGWKSTGVGVGFVTGLGVLTFGGQVLLILGMNPFVTHWMVVIAMMGMVLAAKLRRVKIESFFDSSNHHEVLFILGIALLTFAARHPWLLPFAISVAIAERIPCHCYTSRGRLGSIATLVAVGAASSKILRPANWWNLYLNGDANHMESLSWSTSHWGVLEQPGNLGQSTAAYHWLGHNFFGVLSHLAVLEPWRAMMNIGAPVISVMLASLLLEPARNETSRPNSAQWMLILTLTIGVTWTRVDSFVFGILAALAVLAVFLKDSGRGPRPLIRFALWSLLFATLAFSKTTTSLTLAIALFAFGTYQFTRKKSVAWIPIAACLLTNVVLYVLVFRQSIYSDSVATRLGFSQAAVLELLENTLLFSVTAVLLPIAAMAVLVPQTSTPRLLATTELIYIFTLLLGASIGLGLFGFAYHQRIGTPLLVLIAAVCVWKLVAAFASHSPPSSITGVRLANWTFGLIVIFLTAFAIPVLVNRFTVRFQIDTTDPVVNSIIHGFRQLSPWLILTLVVVALLFKASRTLRTRIAVALTAVTLTVALGSKLDYSRRVLTWGTSVYYNWPANDSPFPNADLANVGKYIRDNTSSDIILASNNFCCFGNRWWMDIVSQIKIAGEESLPFASISKTWIDELPIEQRVHVASISWGGDNYQTTSVTRRRFLMQGLSFQQGGSDRPTPEQLKRMSVSLDFANSPSTENAAILESYGVSGFIVNLSLTKNRDWAPFASEKFRDGQYLYLELR